jgi:hypothetical protein
VTWIEEDDLGMEEKAGKLQMRKLYGDTRMVSTKPHATAKP